MAELKTGKQQRTQRTFEVKFYVAENGTLHSEEKEIFDMVNKKQFYIILAASGPIVTNFLQEGYDYHGPYTEKYAQEKRRKLLGGIKSAPVGGRRAGTGRKPKFGTEPALQVSTTVNPALRKHWAALDGGQRAEATDRGLSITLEAHRLPVEQRALEVVVRAIRLGLADLGSEQVRGLSEAQEVAQRVLKNALGELEDTNGLLYVIDDLSKP